MSPTARDPSSLRGHRAPITARNGATAIEPGQGYRMSVCLAGDEAAGYAGVCHRAAPGADPLGKPAQRTICLNRNVERTFNLDRKAHHWERRKLKRDR
jgi:hypothetical protein